MTTAEQSRDRINRATDILYALRSAAKTVKSTDGSVRAAVFSVVRTLQHEADILEAETVPTDSSDEKERA